MNAPDAAQAAQSTGQMPDDRKSYGIEHCCHCGKEFLKKKDDHWHCSDKCRYAEYDKRNPRINKMPPPEEQPGMYAGKVFDVSLRNANVRAKSVKGGWKYELVAEMTSEDFDLFNGHDLTGSLFEAQIECVEVAQKPLFEEPKPKKQSPEAKPYGKQAAELYKAGFFFNPHVMEKVGTDAQFLEWVKTQPCCVNLSSPGGIVRKSSEGKFHDGDIVPAHVRRISAGAGTRIKPEYSAVPLCHGHHHIQHQEGESALGGKNWFDDQRAKHLSRWMAQTVFGKESMGHVRPDIMLTWCESVGIQQYLPKDYLA